jgi:hypothetical protein
VAVALIASARSHISSGVASPSARSNSPAEFTRMSTGAPSCCTAPANCSTPAGVPRSPTIADAEPPCSRIAATTRSARSASRPPTTTSAPAPASADAIAAPSPLVAPVTTARLPDSPNIRER